MNEDHQTQTDLHRIDNFDDEIELIDYPPGYLEMEICHLSRNIGFWVCSSNHKFYSFKAATRNVSARYCSETWNSKNRKMIKKSLLIRLRI